MSRYIGAGQNDRFDVRIQELVSKVIFFCLEMWKRLLLECLKLNYITFKEDHRFQALGYLGPVTGKTT